MSFHDQERCILVRGFRILICAGSVARLGRGGRRERDVHGGSDVRRTESWIAGRPTEARGVGTEGRGLCKQDGTGVANLKIAGSGRLRNEDAPSPVCDQRSLSPRVRGSSQWRRTRDQGSDLEFLSGSEPSPCP
jgi:hypothetical protein